MGLEGFVFAQELASASGAEAMPLLKRHWEEIAHYHDIELDPDWALYGKMELAGVLRTYSVRLEGRLVGYAVFLVKTNPHYKGSLQAVQDILFIAPEHRSLRLGTAFIEWCDEQLTQEGVEVVYHHVKLKLDFGPLLRRLGYEPIDTIWGKRLRRE